MARKTLILTACFIFFASESLFPQNKLTIPLNIYKQQIGAQYGIYNGSVYELATNISQGHPFFYDDSLIRGAVLYDNFLFTDVSLMLDEVKDELITPDFTRRYLIQLLKEKVDSFAIAGNKFVKEDLGEGPSYYQQLYSGRSQLLKKEIKAISTTVINPDEIQTSIEARTRYYLVTGGRANRIKNRRSFLKLLRDQGTAVKSYLRKRNIKFRTATDEYLLQGIKHYDELSQ